MSLFLKTFFKEMKAQRMNLNSDLLTSKLLFIMHSHPWGVNPNLNVKTEVTDLKFCASEEGESSLAGQGVEER